MTVTNHMMTGALIALLVQRPILAIPLAFLSHFVLDALPHYGYGFVPFGQRDDQKHFISKQATDAFISLSLGFIVPYILRNHQNPAVTIWCMFATFIPDAFWTYQYEKARKQGGYGEQNWFFRFHKSIQWCERSWGIYVEVVWFGLTVWAMRLVTL